MIVELCGLPASGKSTFARELARHNVFTRIKIKRKSELLWFNVLFFLRYPIFFIKTLLCITKNAPSRTILYAKIMNVLLHHNAKYVKAKKYTHSVIDEGHMQNVISLFETRLTKALVMKYVTGLPAVDKVILFDLPEQLLDQRVNERGYFAREGMGDATYRAKWKQVIRHNIQLLRASLEKSRIPHTVVGTQEAAALLLEELKHVSA